MHPRLERQIKKRWESECEHQATAAEFDQAERDFKEATEVIT